MDKNRILLAKYTVILSKFVDQLRTTHDPIQCKYFAALIVKNPWTLSAYLHALAEAIATIISIFQF